jgi:hypothetical protein
MPTTSRFFKESVDARNKSGHDGKGADMEGEMSEFVRKML